MNQLIQHIIVQDQDGQNNNIKIMLKSRKESDTYLAADRRHHQSMQIAMKVDKVCSFQPALRPSSAEEKDITYLNILGALSSQ